MVTNIFATKSNIFQRIVLRKLQMNEKMERKLEMAREFANGDWATINSIYK